MKEKIVKLLDSGQINETMAIVETGQKSKVEKMSSKGQISEGN